MLEVNGVTKNFPGVCALDNVSLSFDLGEIHGLMGENGAGKSTLLKIMTGIYQPDIGSLSLDGKQVRFKNYRESIDYSISMVHQEIQVISESTVAENIILDKIDDFRGRFGRIDWDSINEVATTYLAMVELDVKATDIIGDMTAAQKQLIQIAKALSANAKYILMDEPTSSLSKFEAENLFKIIKKLKNEGKGIVFVSHKIEEVTDICDRVSVLRDGKVIGTTDRKDLTRQKLIKMMIGRDENIAYMGKLDIKDEVALEAKNIGKTGKFLNMNLQVRKGEILGLYGLVGSGRTEFARLIIGADEKDTGEIFVNGKLAHIKNVDDALNKYKIGYVTENRKEEGLILPFSVTSNMTITILQRLCNSWGKINDAEGLAVTNSMIEKLEVKSPSVDTTVNTLSGGNQQKVSISKWLASGCEILIIDEPTVGVDIGAKRHIHDIIWHLAKDEGKTIILISSDMPEILTLARRVVVFKDFQIAGEVTGLNEGPADYNVVSEQIGHLMMT